MCERRMIHLIDTTDNTLRQNTFCFHNGETSEIKENARFGILNFVAQKVGETKSPLEFVFTIDNSGSMREYCNVSRQKIQYIIHILKNMISFMQEKTNVDFYIVINAFNDNVQEVVSRTKVTSENYSAIISKIESINADGSTNIEKALIKAQAEIETIKTQFPHHLVNHILLTDGFATSGSKDISLLSKYIVDDVMNIFIGISIHHDSELLCGLSRVNNKCEYHFIDKLETAGLVCGEILHNILYKVVTDVEIIVSNGLVYDYKTNEWVNKLKIPDIVSEASKTYNIISDNPAHFTVGICGFVDDLIVFHQTQRTDSCDLRHHIFRQKTMELMYSVNQYFSHQNDSDAFCLQGRLGELLNEMNSYIQERDIDINDDKFMKTLFDDVLMCLKNLDDNSYGRMFCSARQTSQGTQRIYTVSNTTNEYRETNDDTYQPCYYDSPYSTSQATIVMSYVNDH